MNYFYLKFFFVLEWRGDRDHGRIIYAAIRSHEIQLSVYPATVAHTEITTVFSSSFFLQLLFSCFENATVFPMGTQRFLASRTFCLSVSLEYNGQENLKTCVDMGITKSPKSETPKRNSFLFFVLFCLHRLLMRKYEELIEFIWHSQYDMNILATIQRSHEIQNPHLFSDFIRRKYRTPCVSFLFAPLFFRSIVQR